MYMGLYTAAYKYGVKPKTVKKVLHYLDRREKKWGDRVRIEVNTKSLEKCCALWHLGPYKRHLLEDDYLPIAQAEKISGIPATSIRVAIIRGRLEGIKNPAGRWLVKVESLRQWVKSRTCDRKSKKEKLNYNWLYPPTKKEMQLLSELWYFLHEVKKYAAKKDIPLDRDWIGKIIHYIHDREKLKGDCIQSTIDDI